MLQSLAKFGKAFPYQTHLSGLTPDNKQEIVQCFWKIFIRESLCLILDSINASKIGTRH